MGKKKRGQGLTRYWLLANSDYGPPLYLNSAEYPAGLRRGVSLREAVLQHPDVMRNPHRYTYWDNYTNTVFCKKAIVVAEMSELTHEDINNIRRMAHETYVYRPKEKQ